MQLCNIWFVFVMGLCGLLLTGIAGKEAEAATSQWYDLGGGKARLLATYDPSLSRIEGAVEVRLDEGWSTYWRYPGSSGIPPRFDFSSSGVKIGSVGFPVPRKLVSGSATYAGYKGTVAFPFSGNMPEGTLGSIKLDLLIGICREICIPAQAKLEITKEQLLKTDPTAQRIVSFSKLSLPETKTTEEMELTVFAADKGTAHISFAASKGSSTPELFVEGPVDWTLEPAVFLGEKEGLLTFKLMLPESVGQADLASSTLHFTFVTGNSGIEFGH